MNKETIVIDGVRYHADRPKSCRGCYFWKNRKVGCSLGKENCYYLAESPKKHSPCEGCCYGPCVSFCMKKCMNEVFGTRMEVPKNAWNRKSRCLQEANKSQGHCGSKQDSAQMQKLLLLSSGVQVQEMPVYHMSFWQTWQLSFQEEASP